MYQSTYTSPPTQPFASPPADPYRSSPIPVNPRQPYSGAFSPPPIPPNVNGFPPMSSGQARYSQYPSSQQYSRAPPNRYSAPSPYAQQPQQLPPARYKGTLAPGKIVQVGDHSVRIERYLSEGGYAHVYLTSSEKPIYPLIKGEKKGRWGERGYTEHCLKRIAFEDEAVWADVKKEIEVMKALPPNPHLTQYLGSAHSRLPNKGYEVFILMEFCAGGGIIDLLNKRLRDRLKEIEILNIFTDVCEAVAAMHALTRPLLHRDLKIENVLSQPTSSPPSAERPTPLLFKLCDFGSTTYPAARPPSTKLEADSLSLDLNNHTTLQYRSPEMVEPMLGWPVGLPSDVWALGVLLYKLCYYTTPFEEHGTLAIVNAKYTFPQYPVYSPRLQHLIAAMLVEQPIRRPTVFEVLKMAHDMSGTRPEVDYPSSSRSIPAYTQTTASQPPKTATSSNLLDFTSSPPLAPDPQIPPAALVPTVQPGRRGRPTRDPSQAQMMPDPVQIAPQPRNMLQQQPPSSAGLHSAGVSEIDGTVDRRAGRPTSGDSGSTGIDAFGVPTSGSGREKPVTGFGDSFGSKASNAGVSQQRPSSRFDGPSRGPNMRSPKPTSSTTDSSTTLFPTTFGVPKTISPEPTNRKTPEPSSSVPVGEVSFETRFPSIETLSSDDAFSPPLPQAASTARSPLAQPHTLISPVLSPSANRPKSGPRQQSIMGSLTGGQSLSAHQPSSAKADRAPQPHSTHVTGTAFQSVQAGMLRPSEDQSRTGYFDDTNAKDSEVSIMPAAGPSKSPIPPDLMTGEESSDLTMLAMQPAMSTDASTSAQRLEVQLPTSSASSASANGFIEPQLPQIDPGKLDTVSGQNSAAKQNRTDSTVSSPKKAKRADSSDEETGPEDASATYRRPASPVRRDSAGRTATLPGIAHRKSAFENGLTNGQARSRSPMKIPSKSATSPLPQPEMVDSKFANQRLLSNERSRPQSMYGAPPSRSSQSLLSPPETQSQAISPSTPSERPAHIRKGSITDMVTRFESMQSPVKITSSNANGVTNGLPKKPSVAAKPAALRKPPTEERDQPARAVSPTKPSSPVKYAPRPVRYSQTPIPHGLSRSSSGRSFPVSKPIVAAKPDVSAAAEKRDPASQPDVVIAPTKAEDASSPEKQQPVNLLIQRWNQGGVAKPQVQPKREKYI